MQKALFLDNREIERMDGFERVLVLPSKSERNPLFTASLPWENGNMQLYGSVVHVPGKPFQLWYSVIHAPWRMYLAYAESDDGLTWDKPLLDLHRFDGEKTNIVLDANIHGPAVIYDELETRPAWKYKLLAGAEPSDCICAYHSGDGIHWAPARRYPVMTTGPDCPMAFFRKADGRYVAHHRVDGAGRRVYRSESWDFTHWSDEARMILEPGPQDPPQMQFYGMGAAGYGDYEIGTLWEYHTDVDDFAPGKMKGYQEAELTYSRSGYSWHRPFPNLPSIPHGAPDAWDRGNLQCASQPVLLDEEIRYYYAGTTMTHEQHWELRSQRAGLGVASTKPDRFVGIRTSAEVGELVTVAFTLECPDLYANAAIAATGWIKASVLDESGREISGFSLNAANAVTGDSLSHHLTWGDAHFERLLGMRIRVRLQVRDATLYSVFSSEESAKRDYARFTSLWP